MKIPQKIFKEMEIDTDSFENFWSAHGLVKKHYCGPMTVHRLCPQECMKCRANIAEGLDVRFARNPYAVAVIRFRTILARLKEQRQIEYKQPRDEFGQVSDTGNPFEKLMEEWSK